jgi:hypothetical protein
MGLGHQDKPKFEEAETRRQQNLWGCNAESEGKRKELTFPSTKVRHYKHLK